MVPQVGGEGDYTGDGSETGYGSDGGNTATTVGFTCLVAEK